MHLPQGWTINSSPDFRFIQLKDASGKSRVRIDPPDQVGTPYDHIHIYNSSYELVDIDGNVVPDNSPAGHIPYDRN